MKLGGGHRPGHLSASNAHSALFCRLDLKIPKHRMTSRTVFFCSGLSKGEYIKRD